MVKNIVRLEGLAIFLISLFFYQEARLNWVHFILFFLVPDISMIGYLKNKKLGALIYNLVHNYFLVLILLILFPISVIVSGILAMTMHNYFLTAAFILSAHVGLDRFMGFGLKYPSHFKDTHIQKL